MLVYVWDSSGQFVLIEINVCYKTCKVCLNVFIFQEGKLKKIGMFYLEFINMLVVDVLILFQGSISGFLFQLLDSILILKRILISLTYLLLRY